MDSFPTIAAPARINYGLSDPYLEDEFESGDAAARPVFTVPREKPMSLSWNAMKPADLATLRAFYDAHRGIRFSWTDPVSDEAKTCRFVGDCLSWKVSTALAGHYQVTLTMRRVSLMPTIESIRESQRQYSDQPYLWLLEINLPSGETIRICRNPEQTGEIEWPIGSGQVWQEFAFEFDDIDETSKAETRQLTLKVANASGVIMQYVEDLEDWRKVHGREPCTIRLIAVNAGLLDQAEPEAEFWFEDKGVSSPPPMKWVVFRVGTMDVFSRSIPRRRILRDYCSWETTDQCQHVATCDRTLRTCRDVYNFSVNFGGFPVVERGAIYG